VNDACDGFVHILVEGQDLVLDRLDRGRGESPFQCQGSPHLSKAVSEEVPFGLWTIEVEHGNVAVQFRHRLGHVV